MWSTMVCVITTLRLLMMKTHFYSFSNAVQCLDHAAPQICAINFGKFTKTYPVQTVNLQIKTNQNFSYMKFLIIHMHTAIAPEYANS